MLRVAVIALWAGAASAGPASQAADTAASPARAGASDVPAPRAESPAARAWTRTHRLSLVIGSDVRNRSGQKIGDLKDLVIDEQGRIRLAIVSTGGFLGLGDRLHAVPWEALRAGADGARVLDMEKAQLSRVPGFSDLDWPDLRDERWQLENGRHFGL